MDYVNKAIEDLKEKYDTKILCPYGTERHTATYGPNEGFYGRRIGKSYMAYYCKPHDAYVGTHNNTTKPLGTLANGPLRRLRMRTHAVVDPLWRSGKYPRGVVYAKLAKYFGKEIHMGESDEAQCEAIIYAVPLIFGAKWKEPEVDELDAMSGVMTFPKTKTYQRPQRSGSLSRHRVSSEEENLRGLSELGNERRERSAFEDMPIIGDD